MRGIIVVANKQARKYAARHEIRSDSEDYFIFDLLDGVVLELGDIFESEARQVGIGTVRSKKHGAVKVFVEKLDVSLCEAKKWVQAPRKFGY